MSKKALLIDYKYCTGCHSCEIACRNEHDIPLDEWGIKVAEYGPIKMNGEWMWDYIPAISSWCDLCEDRLAEGKKPACAHHCLGQCMEVVALENLPKAMSEKGSDVVCYLP